MKKILVILTALLPLICGCATSPVIGPFSYLTTQSNKKARIRRAAVASANLTVDQKKQVFHATSFSSSPNEIAVGVGVDVFELLQGNYTRAELLKNLGGVAGDLTLYGVIGYGIKNQLGDGSGNGDANVDISVSSGRDTSISVSTERDDTTNTDDHSDTHATTTN